MTGWRKSSYSNPSGNCVRVRVWRETGSRAAAVVQVMDSKEPAGLALNLSPAQWAALLARVKAGQVPS